MFSCDPGGSVSVQRSVEYGRAVKLPTRSIVAFGLPVTETVTQTQMSQARFRVSDRIDIEGRLRDCKQWDQKEIIRVSSSLVRPYRRFDGPLAPLPAPASSAKLNQHPSSLVTGPQNTLSFPFHEASLRLSGLHFSSRDPRQHRCTRVPQLWGRSAPSIPTRLLGLQQKEAPDKRPPCPQRPGRLMRSM